MTATLVRTSTTEKSRREPLGAINMAITQARSAVPSSVTTAATTGTTRTLRNLRLDDLDENQPTGENKAIKDTKKRKADYYEDDEGFQFTRIAPKKASSSKRPVPKASPPVENTVTSTPKQRTPRRGRPPKKKKKEEVEDEEDGSLQRGTVEPHAHRGGTANTAKPTPSRRTRGSSSVAVESERPVDIPVTALGKRLDASEAQPGKSRKKGRPSKSKVDQRNGILSPELQPQSQSQSQSQPLDGLKVALPLADTPIIQRNKDMRVEKAEKSQRRDSLGRRGRRASSLIDSGVSNALPHREVETADFYKHIADSLPEPRRMRQLLVWCATRSMGDKPAGSRSEDENARLAARVIQEELLKDFSGNSDLSNWFGRPDTDPPAVVIKKPNPRNIQNLEKVRELEEQLQRLREERQALNALLRPSSIPRIKPKKEQKPSSSEDTVPAPDSSARQASGPIAIDSTILDPSQQAILALLAVDSGKPRQRPPGDGPTDQSAVPTTSGSTPTPLAVSSRLSRVVSTLAPTLDSFAAGVHDIELYRDTADAFSSQILRICAMRLEERDARNTILCQLAMEGGEDNDNDDDDNDDSKARDVARRLAATRRRDGAKDDLGPILGALSRVERR